MSEMLKNRCELPEKMDEPTVPAEDVYEALDELEVINKYLGGYSVMFGAMKKLKLKNEVTIMDLGCGGGDMLRALSSFTEHHNIKVNQFLGIDINPKIIAYAKEKSICFPKIKYITRDIWNDSIFELKPDILISSLFCHHFNNHELIGLIARMKKICNKTIIINDLHRHWIAYHSIKMLSNAFSKSYLVKYDGPLSVARSLKRKEWEWVLNEAGIVHYEINWKWAWRWQIIIYK
jgi:SAM-dependent methyltransferase